MKVEMQDRQLWPAMIITYGAIPGGPSVPQDSFPGGTCFFIDPHHIATAKHIGDIIREEFKQAHMREVDGKQPYGMHVFDPRTGCVWEAVPGEIEHRFKDLDISIITVKPVLEPNEDATHFKEWCGYWENAHSGYLAVRMFPLEEDEALSVLGFTEIEFLDEGKVDEYGRKLEGIVADGTVGRGTYSIESIGECGNRDLIKGWAALGQNSGSPVIDGQRRIVGLISQSPTAGEEEYTVISLFSRAADEAPKNGGEHFLEFKLENKETGSTEQVFLRSDYGRAVNEQNL
jgi:hypothetical protein